MKILCLLGLHKWEIHQIGKVEGRNFLFDKYHRVCQRCGKKQNLQKSEEHYPGACVWVDLIDKE